MNGYDIFDRQIKHKGYRFEYGVEMECRLAAQDAGYTYAEFLSLAGSDQWSDNGDSQAGVLVAYRAKKLIEYWSNEEALKRK